MQIESKTGASNDKRSIQPTTYTINSEQSTDFEMIDESELPVLTVDAEEVVMVRNEPNKYDNVVHHTDGMNNSLLAFHIIESTIMEVASICPESEDSYDNQSFRAGIMQVVKPTITEPNISDLIRNITRENYHYEPVPSNKIDPPRSGRSRVVMERGY